MLKMEVECIDKEYNSLILAILHAKTKFVTYICHTLFLSNISCLMWSQRQVKNNNIL